MQKQLNITDPRDVSKDKSCPEILLLYVNALFM